MTLTASEQLSGGFVRDLAGRLVTVASAGGNLTASEQISGGFVRDADGRLMTIASAGGALTASEQLSGGFVRDPQGRLVISSGTAVGYSGGFQRDQAGRLVTSSASGALGAGEAFSGGFIRDANGLLSLVASGNTYTAAVLADNPVAYYRLGDASGPAIDRMGGPNGVYSGTVTQGAANLLPTQAGLSANFGGGQVTVPDSVPTRIGAGNFTIEAWVKIGTLSTYTAVVDSTSRPYELLVPGGTANLLYSGYGGNALGGPNPPVTFAAGTVYHVVLVAQSPNATAYVNGVAGASMPSSQGAVNSSTGFEIGGAVPANGSNAFSGQIQEVAIYNFALSAARVSAHFAAG